MSAKDWCSKLTFAALEEQGFHVESVEVKGVKGRTKDFMGCFDELAWHLDGRCYLIQSTERGHIQARRQKIDDALADKNKAEAIKKWIEAEGRHAEIWAWGCAKGTQLRKMELLVEYVPVKAVRSRQLTTDVRWAFRWQEVIP